MHGKKLSQSLLDSVVYNLRRAAEERRKAALASSSDEREWRLMIAGIFEERAGGTPTLH